MSEKISNNNDKKKVQSQFDDELFFKYSDYFSNIKIEYVDTMENDFYDKEKQILKITKNPNFTEVNSIISTLDTEVGYNLGVTAKSRLLEYLNNLEKNKAELKANTTLELFYIKNKNTDTDNLENSLLIESLYEEGKKYILETMEAPNSSELLKDKLDLNDLSERFDTLTLKEQKKAINIILQVLYNYEEADNNKKLGGIPMKFVKNKELYCLGFSYLADIIFEKLNIKHSVATGIKIGKEKRAPHSMSVLKLKNKDFVFDPTKSLFLLEIDKIKDSSFKYKDYFFTVGKAETEVLAINIWNISKDMYLIEDKIKTLEYAYRLSKNNILILTDLTKIFKERYELFKNNPNKNTFYKEKYIFYKKKFLEISK